MSTISQAVVDACGLIPTGIVRISHVQGTSDTPLYLVNIHLPNLVEFSSVRVSLGELKEVDVLIGMDIISQGDFAITNQNGGTIFTFRYPSDCTINFCDDDSDDF